MCSTAVLVGFVIVLLATLGEASSCSRIRGTCKDYRTTVCPAGYARGLCSGSNNIRCCMNCDFICRSQERTYALFDGRCIAVGGKCTVSSNYCESNIWRNGMCGGPSSRQCCMQAGGGSVHSGPCDLVNYVGSNIEGYNGENVRINPGFRHSMDLINIAAVACNVKVKVTSSFRKDNAPVNGAIVPLVTKSNHKVGHAIDMNLITSSGWCNSGCLQRMRRNTGEKCFIEAIELAGLRWGGRFTPEDPVHIDDGLNFRFPNIWEALHKKLQRNC